jgi:hypothetical protein
LVKDGNPDSALATTTPHLEYILTRAGQSPDARDAYILFGKGYP